MCVSIKAVRNLTIAVAIVSSLVFLGLTYDSLQQIDARTPPVTAEVAAGKLVWQWNDCIGCHTILGNGSYFAPDLTRVYSRRGEAWLKEFLADPVKVRPGMGMVGVKLTQDDAAALVKFLQWVDGVDTNGWPPPPELRAGGTTSGGQVTRGEAVFAREGCLNCHALAGKGGTAGPKLDGVGAKLSKDTIRQLLENPRALNPEAKMPSFSRLQAGELEELADYLSRLK